MDIVFLIAVVALLIHIGPVGWAALGLLSFLFFLGLSKR